MHMKTLSPAREIRRFGDHLLMYVEVVSASGGPDGTRFVRAIDIMARTGVHEIALFDWNRLAVWDLG